MKLKKSMIDYPASDNPRQLAGLQPNDPKIIELSKSIDNFGLQYSPIVYKKNGKYEAIDGDRRMIACFDILGWDEIDVSVREEPSSLSDLAYLKLAANWDREDFSGIEKGRYLYAIIEDAMKEDGLNIDVAWNNRNIRSEYLKRVSDKLAKSRSSISKCVSAWLQIPAEDRDFIAKNRDDLKGGKLSLAKANAILTMGRKLGDIKSTWREYVPPQEIRKVEPPSISTKEIKVTKKAIKDGHISDVAGLKEFRSSEPENEWDTVSLLVTKEENRKASMIAAQCKIEVSKAWRAAVYVALQHLDEVKEVSNSL